MALQPAKAQYPGSHNTRVRSIMRSASPPPGRCIHRSARLQPAVVSRIPRLRPRSPGPAPSTCRAELCASTCQRDGRARVEEPARRPDEVLLCPGVEMGRTPPARVARPRVRTVGPPRTSSVPARTACRTRCRNPPMPRPSLEYLPAPRRPTPPDFLRRGEKCRCEVTTQNS